MSGDEHMTDGGVRAEGLQKLDKVLDREPRLAQDGPESPRGQGAISVDGDDDETTWTVFSEDMMAATYPDPLEACPLERSNEGLPGDLRQPRQETGTSRSTTSNGRSPAGTSSPSCSAASR